MTWLLRLLLSVPAAGLLLTASAGCGSSGKEAPKLHAVTGKVLYKNSTPAVGTILFRPLSDPSLSASGKTEADGSFSLATVFDNRRLEGALAGEHTVTFVPHSTDQSVLPVALEKKYTIQDGGANNFSIVVDRLPPPR